MLKEWYIGKEQCSRTLPVCSLRNVYEQGKKLPVERKTVGAHSFISIVWENRHHVTSTILEKKMLCINKDQKLQGTHISRGRVFLNRQMFSVVWDMLFVEKAACQKMIKTQCICNCMGNLCVAMQTGGEANEYYSPDRDNEVWYN